MSKKYIIAMDLGTTGNRIFCFDDRGQPIASEYKEFTQHFPKPGWVEHDPEEIWNSIKELIPLAIKKGNLLSDDATAVGITNQRETFLIWDKYGNPLYKAISWQCKRSIEICERLKKELDTRTIDEIALQTGLIIDPYFSALLSSLQR